MKFKKGQHVVCKYQGEGGDLIVGVVDSVRTNGDVILVNLLSNTKSTKKASVLAKRNKVVPKAVALQVLKSSKDKSVIRQNAIAAAKAAEVAPGQLKLPLVTGPLRAKDLMTLGDLRDVDPVFRQMMKQMEDVVAGYRGLSNEMRKEALLGIMETVLMQLP
jgi:hypothetical protein